jgi:hypothetical protein
VVQVLQKSIERPPRLRPSGCFAIFLFAAAAPPGQEGQFARFSNSFTASMTARLASGIDGNQENVALSAIRVAVTTGDVFSDQVADGAADDHVRNIVLSLRDAGDTDCCRQAV